MNETGFRYEPSIPMEAEEEKKVEAWAEYLRKTLLSLYEIELTNTEYLHIRQIAREVFARDKHRQENREIVFTMDGFHPEYEMIVIYLERMYGIPEDAIPKEIRVHERGTKNQYDYQNKLDASKKEAELKRQGKEVWIEELAAPNDAFRKYLKLKREQNEFYGN